MRGFRFVAVQIMVLAAVVVPMGASAAPVNDNFADAQAIIGTTGTVTGSTVDATTETGEPSHGEFASGSSIWYRWTAPGDMTARLDLCESTFDTLIVVYTGTELSALTQVARNNDSFKCRRYGRSRVTFSATAGTTYHIAVDGEFDESGIVTMKLIDLRPPNDDFSYAKTLRGYAVSTEGNIDHATIEEGEPDPFGGRMAKSLWYRWTAQSNGVVTIDTCRSKFDTLLAVYLGGDLSALEQIAKNDDGCGGQSRVIFYVPGGTTIQIQVGAETGSKPVKLEIGLPRPGAYSGYTHLDRNPISFKLASSGLGVADWEFSLELDCYQRGRWIGTFKLKDISIDKIKVARDEDSAAFGVNLKIRFKDGGHMTIEMTGSFVPPDRARGRLKVRIELPNRITCKHWLNSLQWSARR